MLTVSIHQAKTHLSRFVDQAGAGEEILITRDGKPVAQLAPLNYESSKETSTKRYPLLMAAKSAHRQSNG